MSSKGIFGRLINRQSFIELDARERAKALFDEELTGAGWPSIAWNLPGSDAGCHATGRRMAAW